MRRSIGFVALVIALAAVTSVAAGQTSGDYLDDLFAAQDSLASGIDKACANRPDHPRCVTTAPSTTAAPTTTQISTTTTTLASTTSTTVAPTTTAPPTTTSVPISTTTTALSSCQGVQVPAGPNLVNVANAHAAATTFCLAPGTYQLTAAIPLQSGDRWVGSMGLDGARQSVIDGGNSTTFAFSCSCSGGQIRNVIIQRFHNPLQAGPTGPDLTNWLFENIESRENHGFGLHTQDGSIVRNSYIHHNHQAGLGGQGDNVLIEGNEVAFNNYGCVHDWGWEAGGSKWVNAPGLVVRNNYTHHNIGPGFWTDGVANVNIRYENNRAEDNFGPGIFHEIGGAAVITGNTLTGNAFGSSRNAANGFPSGCDSSPATGYRGGILIADSKNVEASFNTLSDNRGAIVVINDNRGTGVDPINLNIHDNDMTSSSSAGIAVTGCYDPQAGTICFDVASNNRWVNNDYHVGGWSTPFTWLDASRTFSAWQGLGHDLTGSVS